MDPLVKGALNGMIKSIKVESNIPGASFTIEEPFADKPQAPPGVTDKAMAKIAPTVTVVMRDSDPVEVAPWGKASSEARNQAKRVGAIVAGAAGIGLIAWVIGKKRK